MLRSTTPSWRSGVVLVFLAAGLVGGAPGAGAPAAGAATTGAASSRTAPMSTGTTTDDVAGTPLTFGTARTHGGAPSSATDPVVGISAVPSGAGYWIAAADGGVFSFGGAPFHGSAGATKLNRPIVGMATTPHGQGYWLVASDGGIFSFGDARFHGSTGAMKLNRPIVGMASTPDGDGYWLVASDGGIFSFGDARFAGSAGAMKLNRPIVGMASTPDGDGYWLVASDGGIFSFGDARFAGSAAPYRPVGPIVGIAATPDGEGYWLASSAGGVYSFGEAHFYGAAASAALKYPVGAIAAAGGGTGYWLLPTTPPPPPPPPPAPVLPPGLVKGHVTAIGDSVMLDAQPDLQADIPGIDVEAAVSRQWDQGVQLAQQLRSEDDLGATVIVDLGTNGPVDVQQFQAMMAVLAGATRVVFVTVHLPPSYSWYQSVNATLEQEVPLYADARLADFDALADQHPEWFGSDGVHMPIGGAGAQAMASLITSTVNGP